MKNLFTVILLIIFLSGVSAAQWELKTNNIPSTAGVSMAIDACGTDTAAISISDSGKGLIMLTTDAGRSWRNLYFPAEDYEIAIDLSMLDSKHIWACTEKRILYTSDGGADWKVQYKADSQTIFINYLEMFDSENGIAMGDPPLNSDLPVVIIKTTDGGNKWQSMNTDYLRGMWSGDTWRRIDFVSPDAGYFFASGTNPQKLYKTTDGGSSWLTRGYAGFAHVIKFFNEGLGLAYVTGKVYRTIDSAKSWKMYPVNATNWGNDIEFDPVDAGRVWLSDYDHLFFSGDTGKTWREQYVSDGSPKIRDIVYTPSGSGWLLCDSGKVYFAQTIAVASEVDKNEIQISGFKLAQNHPNPFNPATKISFIIPHATYVTLKVFDVLGNEIKTLVKEDMSPGEYNLNFDGGDLTSGIYLYQLRAGKFISTKKMILLK